MGRPQKISLLLLRVSLGWLMFYAGIVKALDPSWSAAGYLAGAKTFPAFYAWFASPAILPLTNFLNEWGLTLLGVSLILGAGVRISGILGAILMALYYAAGNALPLVPNGFLVDEHVIYALVLIFLAISSPLSFFPTL